MQYSDLKGMPVVSVQGAEKLGDLDGLLITPDGRQIAAIRVHRVGLLAGHRMVPWTDVKSIGENAVTVPSVESLQEETEIPDYANDLSADDIMGLKVLTASGNNIGEVKDIDFDPTTGQITQYDISSGGLFHSQQQHIPVSAIESIGKNMMVVNNQMAQATENAGTESTQS